jgi:hypothetical protein
LAQRGAQHWQRLRWRGSLARGRAHEVNNVCFDLLLGWVVCGAELAHLDMVALNADLALSIAPEAQRRQAFIDIFG